MSRLFISVQISPEVREELARLQEKLKRENQRLKITWVNPEVMHLTLHFLGDCEDEKIEEIKEIMRNSVGDGTSLGRPLPKLTLVSLDAFPNAFEPRVIVVKSKDEGRQLALLQEKIGRELTNKGFEIDSRPFRTHITLGRVKGRDAINRVSTLDLPVAPLSWQVGSVELMESRLTPAGPIYGQLFSQPLNF